MSGENPFFSVVIPTYNREAVIGQAIQSVIDQTYVNFEVLIVDDGSKDNTKKVVEKMSESDSRIKYIYQDNAERSAARNTGIARAKGRYICFLDSDDLFLSNHLQCFFDFLERSNFPNALVYGNSVTEGPKGLIVNQLPPLNSKNLISILMENSIPSQQVCVHQEILGKYKFNPKIRIGEDRELWFRISESYPILYSDQSTVKIRDLGDRSIDTNNIWAYHENIEHINHLCKIDRLNRIPKLILRSMYSTGYYKLALCYFKSAKRIQAFKYLLRSVFIWPKHQYKYKVIFMLNIIGLRFLMPRHIRNEY